MEEQLEALRTELGDVREELLTHRQVLGQCLEVRDSVIELLQHRDELVQCLELREGVQAVLSSAQIIHEMGDKAAELDLSIAGVSDNTARHGKAISHLVEQQKRTTSIIDAVVRAVKRLDLRRIGRGAGSGGLDSPYGLGSPRCDSAPVTAVGLTNGTTARDVGEVTQRPMFGQNLWEQPGDERVGHGPRPTAMDDPPYCSRTSSCGSEPRPWQASDPWQVPQLAAPPRESTMASCVEGVLARIEEALTNLNDGAGPTDFQSLRNGGFRDGWSNGRSGDPMQARHPSAKRRSARSAGAASGGTRAGRPVGSAAGPPLSEFQPRFRGKAAEGSLGEPTTTARPCEIWRAADSWS